MHPTPHRISSKLDSTRLVSCAGIACNNLAKPPPPPPLAEAELSQVKVSGARTLPSRARINRPQFYCARARTHYVTQTALRRVH